MTYTIICRGIATYRENFNGTLDKAIARCQTVMAWDGIVSAEVINDRGVCVYRTQLSPTAKRPYIPSTPEERVVQEGGIGTVTEQDRKIALLESMVSKLTTRAVQEDGIGIVAEQARKIELLEKRVSRLTTKCSTKGRSNVRLEEENNRLWRRVQELESACQGSAAR